MIQLIEAPPRSGKSYYAVNYLTKFTKFDELYQEYILDNKVLIISNIEGLKINHWNLYDCLSSKLTDKETAKRLKGIDFKQWNITPQEKLQVLKDFFSIPNFEKIMEKTGKNHIILCIDECHDLFPAGMVDNDIYSFFAYHGHIGLDIILMCQSLVATSRMFNPLLEYIVKVTPRSRAILNNFSYSYVDIRGRFLYSKSLPKKDLVFKAYKSFRHDEQTKPKNAVKHWLIVSICFLAVSGFCFKSALAIVKGKSEKGKPAIQQTRINPAPPAAPPQLAVAPLPIQKQISTASVAAPVHGPPDFTKRAVELNNNSPGQLASSSNGFSNVTVKGVVNANDKSGKIHYLLSDGSIVASKKSFRLYQLFTE